MIELPKSIGTIGAGNMAEAILEGLLQSGLSPDQLIASDPADARRAHLEEQLGIRTTTSNAEVCQQSELVVLAVKPGIVEAAAAAIPAGSGCLFLSIAAGLPLARLRDFLGRDARVVRAMPNTPALIGRGVTALAEDPKSSPQDLERAGAVLQAIGSVVRVPESQLDAVTGLSGSGPAYVYLFIEALTDAGIREGLPSDVARTLAIETAVGAAHMVKESEEHPAVLRDRVSSPGGTTVAGLAALEAHGLRAAVLEAVRAATQRSRELAAS